MSYKPLPDYLTIIDSNIDGLGLFAISKLNKGLFMLNHPSHYILTNEDLIRTPLGGFINHSSNPNCTLINRNPIEIDDKIYKQVFYIQPLRDIKAGEELTLDYTKELCGVTGYKDEEWLNNTPKEISYYNYEPRKAVIMNVSNIENISDEHHNLKACLKLTLGLDVDWYIPGDIVQLLDDNNHFFVVQNLPIKEDRSFKYDFIVGAEKDKLDIKKLLSKIKVGEFIYRTGTTYSQY